MPDETTKPQKETNAANFNGFALWEYPHFIAQNIRLIQNAPTIKPNSHSKVRWLFTRLLISMSSGSKNALAISPELPSPTPKGFPKKSLNPASHISIRFEAAASKVNLPTALEIKSDSIKTAPIPKKTFKYFLPK